MVKTILIHTSKLMKTFSKINGYNCINLGIYGGILIRYLVFNKIKDLKDIVIQPFFRMVIF